MTLERVMNRQGTLIPVVIGEIRLPLAVLVFAVSTVTCGGSNGPTMPSNPNVPTVATSEISGTWVQVGGTRTWNLAQYDIQVGGASSFSQDNNPNFGVVSGNGEVVGDAVLGTLIFAETYERLSAANLKPDCYIEFDGQLTISGNSMTGSYTELDSCAGLSLGRITGTLTMRRQ